MSGARSAPNRMVNAREERQPLGRKRGRCCWRAFALIASKSEGQRLYLESIVNNDIVVSIGPPVQANVPRSCRCSGCAAEESRFGLSWRGRRSRPVRTWDSCPVTCRKVDPYLRPLYDALEDIMPSDWVRRALESRTIEIAPLAYMRGRTLADAFVILDEAQNATTAQMKMFSRVSVSIPKSLLQETRRRSTCRAVMTPVCSRSSASCQGSRASVSSTWTPVDVVRHRLVKEIIDAYVQQPTRRKECERRTPDCREHSGGNPGR